MTTYIHFTEEEKQQANQVDLVVFLQAQGEVLLPSGGEKRLQKNHSITVRGNEWYDHAICKGGYAIDFVKEFYDLSFPDAVTLLLGREGGPVYHRAAPKVVTPKSFALPPANGDMRRTFAYLLKYRGIDNEVLRTFVHEHLIYESLEPAPNGGAGFHNVIFVGYDEHGAPKHGHKRGLYTLVKPYKGTIPGSDPVYTFYRKGNSNRLYVFEAPIDLLSFLSLHQEKPWQAHHYVALCGLSPRPMVKRLDCDPTITIVVLCLDNDGPGQRASEKFQTLLQERGLEVSVLTPSLKDFNQDLLQRGGD